MACNRRKGTFGHLRKLSPRISPRSPRHFTTTLVFCSKLVFIKTEKKNIKTGTVVSDKHARIAQADLKRHFTQLSECPFLRVANHIIMLQGIGKRKGIVLLKTRRGQ